MRVVLFGCYGVALVWRPGAGCWNLQRVNVGEMCVLTETVRPDLVGSFLVSYQVPLGLIVPVTDSEKDELV